MPENDLIESAKEFKTSPVRFIILSALFIITALTAVIIYQNSNNNTVTKEKYDALVNERNDYKERYQAKDRECDSLKNQQYQYVLKQLEFERQQKEVKIFIDSMATELKQTLKK